MSTQLKTLMTTGSEAEQLEAQYLHHIATYFLSDGSSTEVWSATKARAEYRNMNALTRAHVHQTFDTLIKEYTDNTLGQANEVTKWYDNHVIPLPTLYPYTWELILLNIYG